MTQPFSVLILTSGRDAHLTNTLAGVARMNAQPTEVVVAFMNQVEHPAVRSGSSVKTIDVSSEHRLPLAEARNALANTAATDALIFLDVDCVPAADFADVILDDLGTSGGVVMGTPRYLKGGAVTEDDDEMILSSKGHPIHRDLVPGDPPRYELFWSLCFAIRKSDFTKAGGFDEKFVGYGGEDTDFAFTCRKENIAFAMSTATAFHQDHPSYDPPLNHFDDIVINARAFFEKWGTWPMKKWLRAFAAMQLIEWDEGSPTLSVMERPSDLQIKEARLPSAVA